MVRHIFLWSIKEGHDAEAVFDELAALPERLPGILAWSIGKHQGDGTHSSTGTWQYGLTSDFETWEDLATYQDHPEHNAIVERVMGSYLDWAVVDYVL